MFKIFKIYNIADSNDTNFYLGSTTTKNINSRWSVIKNEVAKGIERPLHNYIREKGVKNFVCELFQEGEGDRVKANEVLWELTKEFKPSLTNKKEPIACKAWTVERKQEADMRNKEYRAIYHKVYQKEYYEKNYDYIRARQKKQTAETYDKTNMTERNKVIRESKRFYCKLCDVACVSPNALKIHMNSNKHKNKSE